MIYYLALTYALLAFVPAHAGNNPSLKQISRECQQDGGAFCNYRSFISKAESIAIAKHEGLTLGIKPWTAHLVYHYGHKTVIWAINNLTKGNYDHGEGDTMEIHATNGKFLEKTMWMIIKDHK